MDLTVTGPMPVMPTASPSVQPMPPQDVPPQPLTAPEPATGPAAASPAPAQPPAWTQPANDGSWTQVPTDPSWAQPAPTAMPPAWTPQPTVPPQPQGWLYQPQVPMQRPEAWMQQPQPMMQLQPQSATPAAPAPAAQPTWATAAPVVAPTTKRKTGAERATDLLLRLALIVAVAGVAFSVGRATAPKSPANSGFTGFRNGGTGTGTGGGTGTGNGAGTTNGTGTPNGGTGNGSGQNAVVVPGASSAPTTHDQAAPSGAPAIPPGAGTGAGNGNGTTTTGNGTNGTGTGNGQGGGFPGGGPGGFGGGTTGTVASVADGTLSYTTADGQTVEVATTADTTYHQQQAATQADVTVGSSVRISVSGGFGGGGFRNGQGPTASGAPGGFAGGKGGGTPSFTASNVEIVPAEASSGGQGGGRGGFGRGGLTGTVAAIGDGSISLTTAGGQTLDVTTDASTTWTSQADATASAVVPGASIRVTTAGGFGRGQQGTDTGTPQTATDIEVLLPAAQ